MRITNWDADIGTMRLWDGVAAFWVVLWLVVGGWAGFHVWQLTGLSASTVDAGQALGTAGRALQDLAGIPLIGERTGQLGDQIASTGSGIVASGQRADQSIRALAVLIGLSLAVGPAGPVLLLYLPRRRARGREIAEVAAALRQQGASPAVLAHLAHRAVGGLTLGELLSVTADPTGDLATGRHEELARAELRRLGLRLPDRPSP